MTQLLIRKSNNKFTALSDQGMVCLNVPEDDCIAAVWGRFPDLEPDALIERMGYEPTPAEWRSLFAVAVSADMQRLDKELDSDSVDIESLREGLDKVVSAQLALIDEVQDLAIAEKARQFNEAQEAYNARVRELVEIMTNTHGPGNYLPMIHEFLKENL